MALTTKINGIPYPQNVDNTNFPTAFTNLATQIDRRMVPRFASIAARTTAIPSPTAGMLSFVTNATGSQVLQIYRNGAWADMIWGNMVIKQADETRTATTTLSNDAELFFPAEANSLYVVESRLMFFCTNAAVGASVGAYAPAGSVAGATIQGNILGDTAGNSVQIQTGGTSNILTTGYSAGALTASNSGSAIDIRLRINTAGTAGNIGYRWSQVVSSASPTTLYAGSWIRYFKVA